MKIELNVDRPLDIGTSTGISNWNFRNILPTKQENSKVIYKSVLYIGLRGKVLKGELAVTHLTCKK